MADRVMDISGESVSMAFFPDGMIQDKLSLLCGRAAVIAPRGLITGAAAAGLLGKLDRKNRERVLLKGEAGLTAEGAAVCEEMGVRLLGTEGERPFSENAGKITVLTGLDLRGVQENIYELHAIPLETGAEKKTRVRAVLEKCRKAYKMTTLCYIRRDDSYLMLYRNKKENDENEGKWIGIGGKIEEGESPEQCVRREVFEETGLTLLEYSFRGIVTFVNDVWENEYMMLYEGTSFSGELRRECDEGELAWVPFDQIMDLPLWEGDRVFLEKLISGDVDASCRLEYHNDHLTKAT